MPYNADTSSYSYLSTYLPTLGHNHCVETAVFFSIVTQFCHFSSPHFTQPDHLQLNLSCSFNHLFWCHFPQLPLQHLRRASCVGYSYSNLQCDLKVTSIPSYGGEEEEQHNHRTFDWHCPCCQPLQGLCSPGKRLQARPLA